MALVNALMVCTTYFTPNDDPGREYADRHPWTRPLETEGKFYDKRYAQPAQCPDHDGLGGGDAPVQGPEA